MSVATGPEKTRGAGAALEDVLFVRIDGCWRRAVVLLLGIGVVVVFVDPFAGTASRHGGAVYNGSPSSTRPVERTSLSSQTQVSGTLVYAGSRTVSVPAVAPGQAVYTMLPSAGRIVRRGRPLFTIDGEPTLLLYGSTPVWRSFQAGMSPGTDVAELNANLRALGLDAPAAMRSPRRRAQRSLGTAAGARPHPDRHAPARRGRARARRAAGDDGDCDAGRTGSAGPGPDRNLDPTARLGPARRRPAVGGEGRRPGQRDPPRQPHHPGRGQRDRQGCDDALRRPAERRRLQLADDRVDVRLLHPSAAGNLDQAPVEVSITDRSVSDALVVPVNALLALAGGGYAVERSTPTASTGWCAVDAGDLRRRRTGSCR